MENHNDLCVGIDLGTTNSVLATINEKSNGDIVSKVVDIARGTDMYNNAMSGEAKLTMTKKPTLPSCVYYRQEKGYEPLVGDFAKVQYPLRPHLVAKSIKSQMGNDQAEGLSPDIPDKTPAEISSRILQHMLREASKVYRCEIQDAVITVPANFDSVMCKATRDAAELAGIQVRNDDGSERPILLSEPNAVIYDLINQIHNGEISHHILDLSSEKKVMVFDLGGGTLDITMHTIKRREGNKDVVKVDEIATNRYTLLGGDDFDEEIAKSMFERYIKQYSKHDSITSKLRKDKDMIMSQLRVYAENLKLDINENNNGAFSGWDDPDEEEEISIGGNMGGIGYSYDDTFTKTEVENILSVFMGKDLVYPDYKRIDKIKETRNIIYPILDVLKKASDKMGESDIKVDAVIVNGGMSKFYMVTDRLKEFFGFEPIVALDPDQAVARGAAVYHYYLHRYEDMQDDMRMVGTSEKADTGNTKENATGTNGTNSVNGAAAKKTDAVKVRPRPIEFGKSILNDALYLGVKNGAVHEIIPTGASLPYTSNVMTGFMVEPGQNMISIPIKVRDINGAYKTIASGTIKFGTVYKQGAYVAFTVHMSSNKVILMKAWTSTDIDGVNKLEEKFATIETNKKAVPKSKFSNNLKTGAGKLKAKVIAPSGSILKPQAEINSIIQLCKNYESSKNTNVKMEASSKINASISSIYRAANKKEFAPIILGSLQGTNCNEAVMRLLVLARKMSPSWDKEDRDKLAKVCINQLGAELSGFSLASGSKVNINIQAIMVLGVCGDADQMSRLVMLHTNTKYVNACLYAHAKTRTSVDWIVEQFNADAGRAVQGYKSNIQSTAHAVGVALKREGMVNQLVKKSKETEIVNNLCKAIGAGRLAELELLCCIVALGCICDQRTDKFRVSTRLVDSVKQTLDKAKIGGVYRATVVQRVLRSIDVVLKMLTGLELSVEDEQFLLTKLEM